jgi:site-specific recombinase XerD
MAGFVIAIADPQKIILGLRRPWLQFILRQISAGLRRRYQPGKLSEMTAKYVKMAGLKRSGACHLFRHVTATSMLENGAEL